MESTKMAPELELLKNKLRATWIAGDFGEIAKAYASGASDFVDSLGIKPGMKVLDVACGTGNLALQAARAGADVTGLDIAPNLIELAKANAASEGLNIQFDIGDVEDMPYEDANFDAVITMFGAMFAPRPDVTAKELKRGCLPGALIAMANWTPAGFIGQMFKTTSKHVPPPVGMPSPLLWGDEESVLRRFADGVADLQMKPRNIDFTFPFGPVEVVEHFRKFYGPTQKAFEALDPTGQDTLRRDLEQLWTENNKAADGATRVESEYLDVRVIRD